MRSQACQSAGGAATHCRQRVPTWISPRVLAPKYPFSRPDVPDERNIRIRGLYSTTVTASSSCRMSAFTSSAVASTDSRARSAHASSNVTSSSSSNEISWSASPSQSRAYSQPLDCTLHLFDACGECFCTSRMYSASRTSRPLPKKGTKKNLKHARGTKHYAQLKSVSGFFLCPFWARA
jgi:hypothetical protein